MAVKWAIANGNWSAGTTWNDGVVPTIGDDVYLDGYRVTANVDVVAKNISNAANPDEGIVAGGYLYITASNRYVTANLFAESNEIVRMVVVSNQYIYVVGNVVTPNISISAFYKTNQAYAISVVGNIFIRNGSAFGSGGSNYTIAATVVGNIATEGSGYVFGDSFATNSTLTINGNCDLATNIGGTLKSVIINGLLTKRNTVLSSIVNLTIGGDVFYENVDPLLLFKNVTNLSFTNVNSVIKDITTPRIYPYVIITDAEMNNRQQYPPEDEVKEGTEYVWGEKVGTYQQPPESVVLKDYVYDNGEKVGSLENQNIVGCVTPEDVRKDVPLVGMGVVGTLVVPSVDDVREGVVFDNGSVGTLIVQGGGERLRIANFGYYTDSQSDTYIVDLTEQDKPKFAVAEERVLIEMFPELDIDNIPDKYFDDLFVKYLKYRLIVEYYRTAGINSTFTPSEPTTEIVNYRNVNCEIWMNIANTYLKAWGTKYPNSIKKQRILL